MHLKHNKQVPTFAQIQIRKLINRNGKHFLAFQVLYWNSCFTQIQISNDSKCHIFYDKQFDSELAVGNH